MLAKRLGETAVHVNFGLDSSVRSIRTLVASTAGYTVCIQVSRPRCKAEHVPGWYKDVGSNTA